MTGPASGQFRTVMGLGVRRVRRGVDVVLQRQVVFEVGAGPAARQRLRFRRVFAGAAGAAAVCRSVLLLDAFVFQKPAGETRGRFGPAVGQILAAAGRGVAFPGAGIRRRCFVAAAGTVSETTGRDCVTHSRVDGDLYGMIRAWKLIKFKCFLKKHR